jgi:hypothetical protein
MVPGTCDAIVVSAGAILAALAYVIAMASGRLLRSGFSTVPVSTCLFFLLVIVGFLLLHIA